MKFKVGDKVKIKNNLKEIEGFCGGYIDDLDEYIGNIYTIKEFCVDNKAVRFEEIGWTWDIRTLELANKTNTELTINTTGITISEQFNSREIKFNIMPDRYIINKGATVLFWEDGTKTIVKKTKKDNYDKRIGFLTAYFQKMSGMSKTKANKYLDSLVEEEK